MKLIFEKRNPSIRIHPLIIQLSRKPFKLFHVYCLIVLCILFTVFYCYSNSQRTQLRQNTFNLLTNSDLGSLAENSAQVNSWIFETVPNVDEQNVIVKRKRVESPIRKFNPSFTLGLYLSLAGNTNNLNEVPFHWYDWTDLNRLDETLISSPGNKPSCRSLWGLTSNERKQFCKDMNLNDQKLESIGMDIFKAPDFKFPPSEVAIIGLSYLYRNAPLPNKIVFISNDSLVSLNVTEKKQIDDSDIFERVLGNSNLKIVNLPSALQEAKTCLQKVDSASAKSVFPLPDTKHIPLESFTFDVFDAINDLAMHKDDLSPMELKYLKSLFYSESSKHGDYSSKHFNEPLFMGTSIGLHHDWRFFKRIPTDDYEKKSIIHRLIRTWLDFANKAEINTWVAHGSLLAWNWNGLMFPWDDDIDVQVPIADLHKLARNFNQSIIVEDVKFGHGRYLLDIGAYITERTKGDNLNNIDARFIDLDSGMYVDITALSTSSYPKPSRYDGTPSEQIFNCRNNHFFSHSEISPLYKSVIEAQVGYIPNNSSGMLDVEYEDGLKRKQHEGNFFVDELKMWVNSRDLHNFITYPEMWTKLRSNKKTSDSEWTPLMEISFHSKNKYSLSDSEVELLGLMKFSDFKDFFADEDTLIEYMISKDLTSFHTEVQNKRSSGKSTSSLLKDFKSTWPRRMLLFTYRSRGIN